MPGPGRRNMGPRPKLENPGAIFKRVLSYIFRFYKWHYIIVIAMIFITVFCSLQGTMFMRTLIDDYIEPMLKSGSTDFSEMAKAIARVACFFALGVVAGFTQNRIMVYVTQGTMRSLRNDLFEKMERNYP